MEQNTILKNVVDFLSLGLTQSASINSETNFHTHHPRYQALIRMTGEILDIGSGDGGLGQLINWPISLPGKSLVGCDLHEINKLPNGYSAWISGGYQRIPKDHYFDGVFAIHVIEHLKDWRNMLEIALKCLKPGEYIYIEWPVAESEFWPSASSIWESFNRANGKKYDELLTTFNFYDDGSHLDKPPDLQDVLSALSYFEVIECGAIYLPETALELVARGLQENSIADTTMGVWAQFGFAQRVLARKNI